MLCIQSFYELQQQLSEGKPGKSVSSMTGYCWWMTERGESTIGGKGLVWLKYISD